MDNELIRFSVLLPKNILAKLKAKAVMEDRVYNLLVCESILRYLNLNLKVLDSIGKSYNPVGRPKSANPTKRDRRKKTKNSV
jgi:hypothetical protein